MAKTRDYRAEYARRIAAGLARGKTRQQARGQREGEARRRAEREREEFGITGGEARAIRAWVERTGNKSIDPDDVIERARDKGYDWFQNFRDVLNSARRNYQGKSKRGTYASLGEGYLETLADLADVDDISWVYYH